MNSITTKCFINLICFSTMGVSANQPIGLTVPTFAVWNCGSLSPEKKVTQQFPYITIVRNDLKLAVQESDSDGNMIRLLRLSKVGSSNSPVIYTTSGTTDIEYKFTEKASISTISVNNSLARVGKCKPVVNKLKHFNSDLL